MTYNQGPGGHRADGTGPYGSGNGPGGGRADGSGMKNNVPYRKEGRGPGGNIPDGKGSKGAGMGKGVGQGEEDGSGLEKIAKQQGWEIGPGVEYVISTKNYKAIQSEYSSLYSQYGGSDEVRKAVARAHNEAINKGYHGSDREEYVEKAVMEELGEGKESE